MTDVTWAPMFTTHAVDNPFPKTAARPSCITQFKINHHLLGNSQMNHWSQPKHFYYTCGMHSRNINNNNTENVIEEIIVNEKRKYEREELFFYMALTSSISHILEKHLLNITKNILIVTTSRDTSPFVSSRIV